MVVFVDEEVCKLSHGCSSTTECLLDISRGNSAREDARLFEIATFDHGNDDKRSRTHRVRLLSSAHSRDKGRALLGRSRVNYSARPRGGQKRLGSIGSRHQPVSVRDTGYRDTATDLFLSRKRRRPFRTDAIALTERIYRARPTTIPRVHKFGERPTRLMPSDLDNLGSIFIDNSRAKSSSSASTAATAAAAATTTTISPRRRHRRPTANERESPESSGTYENAGRMRR